MKMLVFDIGGTAMKYGVCTNGRLSGVQEAPSNALLGGRHIMDTVAALIRQESGYDAIGISTAGQVDSAAGRIIYANSNIPGYTGMEVAGELEQLFPVPVIVENDVNCAAMGEAVYGAGREHPSFLCLTYGTGVGGAIIQDRLLFHGSTFCAGEFGGIVTHGCANLSGHDVFDGCYERFASTTALVRSAMEYNGGFTNGRILFEHLDRPAVRQIIDRWIDEVLLGLISITHIFNPACIVLGGGVMVQPYVTDQIRERLCHRIMPSFAHVTVKPAALGNAAGLLGIYALAAMRCDASDVDSA